MPRLTMPGPRWRWALIHQLDRLHGQCWTNLVSWAMVCDEDRDQWWNPSRPQRPSCREDAANLGGCYCGKIRSTPNAEPRPVRP